MLTYTSVNVWQNQMHSPSRSDLTARSAVQRLLTGRRHAQLRKVKPSRHKQRQNVSKRSIAADASFNRREALSIASGTALSGICWPSTATAELPQNLSKGALTRQSLLGLGVIVLIAVVLSAVCLVLSKTNLKNKKREFEVDSANPIYIRAGLSVPDMRL